MTTNIHYPAGTRRGTDVVSNRTDLPLNNPRNMALELSIKMETPCLISRVKDYSSLSHLDGPDMNCAPKKGVFKARVEDQIFA